MTSLICNEQDKQKYFYCLSTKLEIMGIHDSKSEIRGELGYLMKQLKESDHNDKKVDNILHEIYDILNLDYSFEKFYKQYMIYLRLIADRQDTIDMSKKRRNFCCIKKKLSKVPLLNRSKWNMWGSYKQFIFGKCVVDVLNDEYSYNLHPIWGCLLSPTGGIVGAGNKEIISSKWNSFISLHGCVHDASGYLYSYHGLGLGYNYLNTYKTLFPTSSPFSCQYAGLRFWRSFI